MQRVIQILRWILDLRDEDFESQPSYIKRFWKYILSWIVAFIYLFVVILLTGLISVDFAQIIIQTSAVIMGITFGLILCRFLLGEGYLIVRWIWKTEPTEYDL